MLFVADWWFLFKSATKDFLEGNFFGKIAPPMRTQSRQSDVQ
jgi:hypothetical protein